jgi:hypothetical protein
MQLDDVRDQLRELSDHVPSGSSDPSEVLARTRRTVKRRRLVRSVALRGALALIVVTVAVAINASGHSSTRQVIVSQSTTTGVVPAGVPFTAEQLRAHDGADVPKGWVPIDAGDARVWVPGNWTLETLSACNRTPERFIRIIANGSPCGATTHPEDVSISAIPRSAAITPTETVHGYGVSPEFLRCDCPNFSRYDVPELGVQLGFTGELADRILATLAPSARKVALAFAEQPVPKTFRRISDAGLNLSVPPEWPEGTRGAGCGGLFASTVVHVHRLPADTSCQGPTAPSLDDAGHDGVVLYASSEYFASNRGRRRITVLHHGATTVTVFGSGNDPSVVDLVVRRAGSKIAHSLSLGLGRDGRVAGGILASIEATS